jgi:uncharacterized protein YbaA (DUF1428 family)
MGRVRTTEEMLADAVVALATKEAEATALRERVEVLEGVLRPFADLYDNCWAGSNVPKGKLQHFRHAAQVLAPNNSIRGEADG